MATLAAQRGRRFARLSQWVFQPRGPETGEILLKQRRVFIFPTRHGFFFAFSLLAFLAASINYDLALGFVLTFFLAAAGLVAMLHTFRNQVHLVMRPLRAEAVFAGMDAVFELMLDNRRDDERAAVWLKTAHAATVQDLPAHTAPGLRDGTPDFPARLARCAAHHPGDALPAGPVSGLELLAAGLALPGVPGTGRGRCLVTHSRRRQR